MDLSTQKIFAPLIGQLAWAVEGGSATFITMEFGNPHLLVRKPRTPRDGRSPEAQRNAARRKVIVYGDWHLFIEFANWKITTVNGSTSSEDENDDWWKPWLDDISGQRLLSVESSQPGWLTLRFDLGGVVEVWPAPGIENDVWTLHPWEGDIVGCSFDGTLHTEVGRGS